MEGNITHTGPKNQKSITWGKSFKCMMKGDKLNQPMHMAGHILSPSSCTYFSPSIMKSPSKDSEYYIVPLDSFYHAAEMLSPLM